MLKVTDGFCDVEDPLVYVTVEGLNVHNHEVGDPIDWSVKLTTVEVDKGIVLLAVKFAVGGKDGDEN